VGLAVLCLVLGALRPAAAEETITARGEIVDLACYMAKGSRGTAHKTCAQMCAKRGVPIGLLTDAGELYLLLDDHDNPDPYEAARKLAGERAEVNGKQYSKQGVASIVVTATKAL